MSINYIIHKSKIYLLAGLLPMAACTDDFLQENRVEVNTSESITFDASVALTSSSYSRSTTTSYEPLVLQAEDAADFPLYLHTYEHALGEKVEEMGAEMSRGAQVNSPKDLYDIHETFGIRGTYSNSGGATSLPCGLRILHKGCSIFLHHGVQSTAGEWRQGR